MTTDTESQARTAWLASLKSGDAVIVHSQYRDTRSSVERVTATQIAVRGVRYRREDGREMGASGYDTASLQQATPERMGRVMHRQQAEALRSVKWADLPADVVARVHAEVEAAQKAQKGGTP